MRQITLQATVCYHNYHQILLVSGNYSVPFNIINIFDKIVYFKSILNFIFINVCFSL